MPIFEYHCNECEIRFEVLHRAGNSARTVKCPVCGAQNPTRCFSAFATGSTTQKESDTAGVT